MQGVQRPLGVRVTALVVTSLLISLVCAARAVGSSAPAEVMAGGPMLAGDRAVWAETGNPIPQSYAVNSLDPSGNKRTLYSRTAPPGSGEFGSLVSASPNWVTFDYVERQEVPGQFGNYGQTSDYGLLLARADGGDIRRLDGSAPCQVYAPRLWGDLMFSLSGGQSDCSSAGKFVVRDLSMANPQDEIIPWSDKSLFLSAFRVTGPYMAFLGEETSYPGWPPHVAIIVIDWQTGEELYRAQIGELLTKEAPRNYEVNFALDGDGTVAIDMGDYTSDIGQGMLLWASPAEPYPHRLPGITSNILAVAIHDHLIAVRREHDWAILDLKGDVVEAFDHESYGRGEVDFDGRRVVWGNQKKVYNEPFPVVAAARPAAKLRVKSKSKAPIPIRCTAARRCTGKLVLSAATGGRLGASRFTVAPSKTHTVTVKLAAFAQRTLAQKGTLRAIARLTARSTGIDVRSNHRLVLHR